MLQITMRSLVMLGLVGLVGCGTPVAQVDQPVDITVKVTMGGKPLDGVTMTLQPMVDGAQAALPVEKGELKGTVVPGVYTYYIDSGKSEAALAKIPDSFRMGSKERKLEILAPGSYEVQIN